MNVLNLSDLSIDNISRLNKISIANRKAFNSLTEDIYQSTDKSIGWITSGVISRNPFLSDLHLKCCYLDLVLTLLEEKTVVHEIITNDSQLEKVLSTYFKKIHSPIKVVCNLTFFSSLKIFLHQYYSFLLCLWWIYPRLFLKRKNNAVKYLNEKGIILVDTFILDNSIKAGRYIDRYYPGLIEYISNYVESDLYFVPTIQAKHSRKDLVEIEKNSKEKFLFKNDFLKVSDYFISLLSLIYRRNIFSGNVRYKNFEINSLIKGELKKTKFNNSILQAMLDYRFVKRLSENGIKIISYLDWFENQVIDKAMNYSLNKFYPDTPRFGYQGFPVTSDYHLYLQPTNYEYRDNLIPQKIFVMGSGFIRHSKQYCDNLKVGVAPSFRYSYLRDNNDTYLCEDDFRITLALPLNYDESIEIINLLMGITRSLKEKKAKLYIKAHPALDIKVIMSRCGDISESDYHVVDESFINILKKSSLLISSASSTCIEAIALGVPAIVIGPLTRIIQNPIPIEIQKDMWSICYTQEELLNKIDHYLNLTRDEKKELKQVGNSVLDNFFEPVNYATVEKFLNELRAVNINSNLS